MATTKLDDDTATHKERQKTTRSLLQAQLAVVTNLLQTMALNQVNTGNDSQMNAVNQVTAIGCWMRGAACVQNLPAESTICVLY